MLEGMGIDSGKIPRGFQRIGDIIILRLPGLEGQYREIGERVLGACPGARTVCVNEGVRGELREPSIRVIAGDGTVAEHRENGCLFKLDVSRVMFSKGNARERGRLPGLAREGETVVDMFAGIGYFSVPLARSGRPGRVIAIEKNPLAFGFLKENIGLNGLGNVEAILGDCRGVCKGLGRIADRVVMGYLPGTEGFLQSAFSVLKERGVIHYHNVYREEELWEGPFKALEGEAGKAGFRLDRVLHKMVVKGYAPGVKHVVVDGEFSGVP